MGAYNVELQDIKEFVLLANLCNYQEAADALFISQSTLSRHIQRLEKELGNRLFDRTTRKMRLSNFGKMFLPCAQELVCVEHSFREEYREYSNQESETIHICAIPTMAAYRFTDILANFRNTYPQYRIEVEELVTLEGLFERIADGTVDFAMIHGPDEWDEGIGHFTLFDDHLVAALPLEHPLANMESLRLSALKNESFITPPATSAVVDRLESACREQEFKQKISYSGHREDVLLSLVRNGFGIGILTRRTAEYSREEGVKLVELSPGIPLPVSIAFANSSHMTTGKKLFLECCRDIADGINSL